MRTPPAKPIILSDVRLEDRPVDLRIEDGRIAAIGHGGEVDGTAATPTMSFVPEVRLHRVFSSSRKQRGSVPSGRSGATGRRKLLGARGGGRGPPGGSELRGSEG